MATVPGFAKDSVGRWRIVEMEVTATSSIVSKTGVSPSRASPMANPLLGALNGFLDMRYRSACAEFLILLRARSAGSLSARPLQNRRISGMRRCHRGEPRNNRTLVSSPSAAIAMSVWRTSTI